MKDKQTYIRAVAPAHPISRTWSGREHDRDVKFIFLISDQFSGVFPERSFNGFVMF